MACRGTLVWGALLLLACPQAPRCRCFLAAPRVRPVGQRLALRATADVSTEAEEDWSAVDVWLPSVREGVAAAGGGEVWAEAAKAMATAMDADFAEAEQALAKALGWKAWAEMNRPVYLKPPLPAPGTVRDALEWLAFGPLGLTPPQIRRAVANSPKVYITNPASSYAAALEAAPEPWAGPAALKELILREPRALQLTWNCELTDPKLRGPEIHCDGKCVNCWRTAKPRFLGQVTSYVKFSGYGWAEMIQKGVVPGDKVYVFWKSITTDDRFPQLQPEMLIEFGLHLTPAGGGSYQLRAKNVTLPGGLPICIQDDADSAKKVFVGGQHIRYTGKLRYYSTKWGGSGKVVLDDGYAFDEAVPKELVVELPEVNCGGKAPFDMKDLEVEFGIWKTQKGLYKVYNMTLPGGAPFSKEAIEHRQVVPGRVFRGKVKKNMWQQGWGLVAVDPGAALPPDVIPKVKTSKDSEAGEVLLYFREADVKDGQWLKTGQDVLFSVYVDDKGAGACDLHAAELPPKTGLA